MIIPGLSAVAATVEGRRTARHQRIVDAGRLLPGDQLLSGSDACTTRGITIAAAPEAVWPWIAQLGQGRGGFYSYDALENLFGCQIHSADRIHPEWQDVAEGSAVNLAPQLSLVVASVIRNEALVLRGGVPVGAGPPPFDFTWCFAVFPLEEGSATRLVVRERYRYQRSWAPFVVRPATVISGIMSRKMLAGINDRAVRTDADLAVAR